MLRTGPHPLSAAGCRRLERSRRVSLRGEQVRLLATDRERAACRSVPAGPESPARQRVKAARLHPLRHLLAQHRTGSLAAQMPVGLLRAARGLTAGDRLPDRTSGVELPATAVLWASPTGRGPRACSGREMSRAADGVLGGKKETDSHEAPGATVNWQACRQTAFDPSPGSIAAAKARESPSAAATIMFTSTATSTPRTPRHTGSTDITRGCDTPASDTTGIGMITADFFRLDGPVPVTAE